MVEIMLNIIALKLNNKALSFARILNGVIILFLTSQITIPLEPVPITLQTAGVMLIGLTFNRREAIYSVISYLVLGASGLPLFADFSGGMLKLIGPTGGYLIGFLASVAVMTTIRQFFTKESIFTMFLSSLIGTMVIFAFGIAWLSKFVGFEKAITVGFMPFIATGMLKVVFTAMAVRYIKFGRIIK
ncbi:MAG: bioY family protein [Rickettsiaceae bacterium]|jgi:biotin transport system substrate-specific component|nr:bioY family protein [Rickettsiaceae bacterium]